MKIVNAYLVQIVLAALLALAAFLGAQAKGLYRKYVTTDIKQSVCRTAVRFVEQVYVDLHGPEKLQQAMARASAILEEYGIVISEMELVAMIEAAVNEFNNAFEKNALPGKHEKTEEENGEPSPEPEEVDSDYVVPNGSVDLRNLRI